MKLPIFQIYNLHNQTDHEKKKAEREKGYSKKKKKALKRVHGNTSIFAILRGSRLSQHFKIDKAKGHEAQSEPRHQTSKHHQENDHHYINKKPSFATLIFHRHYRRQTLLLQHPKSKLNTKQQKPNFLSIKLEQKPERCHLHC